MPKSEEWSQRAWKWQEIILQNLKWTDKQNVSYTLEDLMAFGIEWPKMIMPEQGWLGDGESVSFCGGEALVGLGVRNFKRIAACPWEEQFSTSIKEIKKRAKPKYIIPLSTMGELRHASRVKILQIQSEGQVYPTMEDLWMFHPRYAKPNKTFTVGNIVVKRQEKIELKAHENGCITCYLPEIDKTVPVPMKQRGDFVIVGDLSTYTLQEVYENFNLPQRVFFVNHPPGLSSTDVLLISETRYDVLITCVTAGLYVDEEDDERKEPWGTRDEDFLDVSFIFLPKPINDESPIADTKFFTWQYDPNDPTCQIIMSRASVFEMERFKDINVVINANSTSMSAVKQCSGENIYDYIKVHDFIGDYLEPSSLDKSPAKGTAPSWLHSGTTKADPNPYNEEPSRGPKPESKSKKLIQRVKKLPLVLPFKRNKSESDASQDKPEPRKVFHTLPRTADSKMKPQAPPRIRQGSLPPLPNDESGSEEEGYENMEDFDHQAEKKKISERGRLPLPGEVAMGEQEIVQPPPLPKLPSEDMHKPKNEKDVIAQLGPPPRPPADASQIQQPPPRPPKPGKGKAVDKGQISAVPSQEAALQGQVAVGQGQSTLTQGQEAVTKEKVAEVSRRTSLVQRQVAALQGQAAVDQGQSTSTQCRVAVTTGKVAVVQGQTSEVQGRTAVVQGQRAVVQGRVGVPPVPTLSAQGGPRRVKFPPPNGNLMLLSELTAEQLAILFEYFNLEQIAEQMKSNKVDGAFFENSLESEDFAGSPFFASDFQRKQIERIRNGKY